MGLGPRDSARAYARLVQEFQRREGTPPAQRWQWLMAAHIVGQTQFGLHLRSHALMLQYAIQIRAWTEAVGQLLRLALVPVGHLVGRLPIGNSGRATVSAFQPMSVSPDLQRMIRNAVINTSAA